jgi:hypothetical protein
VWAANFERGLVLQMQFMLKALQMMKAIDFLQENVMVAFIKLITCDALDAVFVSKLVQPEH